MRFAAPQAFLLLPLLPLVAWFYLRRGRTATVRFSSLRRVGTLGRSVRLWARPLLLVLRLAALALLIVAIARPQTSRSETRVSTEGIALEMVVDRSSSMRAEMDFEGERLNRLEVVKRVFTEFVVGNGDDLPGRPHDLIGMIAFARFADTAAPLVRAHDALVQFVQDTKIAQFEAGRRDGHRRCPGTRGRASQTGGGRHCPLDGTWYRRRLHDQEQSDHPAHRRAQQCR